MRFHRTIPLAAVPLLVGLTVIGAGAGAAGSSGSADTAAAGPLRCEIQKSPAGGGISLAAIVHSDAAVSGSYSFHVTSGGGGGSSNINQGGPFTADPKAPVTLGTVLLAGGATYNATLTVTASGGSVTCSEKAGAI